MFTKLRPSLGLARNRDAGSSTSVGRGGDLAWTALPRPTVFDALRRARRDLTERLVSTLVGRGTLDRYRDALTYGAPAFAGASAPAAPSSAGGIVDRLRGLLPRRLPGAAIFAFVGSSSVLMLLAGGVLFAGGQAAFQATNTEQFCVSCHEMRDNNFKEYKGSIHDSNRSGVRAMCPDCHVPKETGPALMRKAGAVVDLYSHFITGAVDTKAKFNAERSRMAQKVWIYMKETDSRECRSCHDATSMMASDLHSKGAKSRHEKAVAQGKTCIDCHFGIAHSEPTDGPSPADLKVERKVH